MNKLSHLIFLALGIGCIGAPARAALDPWSLEPAAGGAAFFAAHDTEGFSTRRLALEALPVYEHGDRLTGVRYTESTYTQDQWRREGQQLSLLTRNIDPVTANGWNLEAGAFHQSAHNMLTLDGNVRHALADKTTLEVFIDREWVETQPALDQGVRFTLLGASLDQGLGEHLTLVGMAGAQRFSDGNERNHLRGRLIYQPLLDSGVTLQLRYRLFRSSTGDTAGTYFNPRRYDEAMLALGWRKRVQGWTVRAAAGSGRQHVDEVVGTDTRLLELGLESPHKGPQFLRLRGGYSRSASFQGPDYAYTYAQGEWILRF